MRNSESVTGGGGKLSNRYARRNVARGQELLQSVTDMDKIKILSLFFIELRFSTHILEIRERCRQVPENGKHDVFKRQEVVVIDCYMMIINEN